MDINDEIKRFAATFPTLSHYTKRGYLSDLKIFASWLEQQKLDIQSIQPVHIRSYALWLNVTRRNFKTKQQGLAASAVNRKIAALQSFFEYLIEEQLYPNINPVRKRHYLRMPHRLPCPIGNEPLKTLMQGIKHVRDKALFLMYLESGMRLSELISMDETNLKIENHQQDGVPTMIGKFTVMGKGSKERIVYVNQAALKAYLAYLEKKPPGSNALFVNRSGVRLTPVGVYKRLKFWCRKLNLKGIHPHRLRHTYATRLIDNGMRIEHLSELMGHSNINTTKKYVLISQGKVRESFMNSTSLMEETKPKEVMENEPKLD